MLKFIIPSSIARFSEQPGESMKHLCLLCTWHALANLWVRMLENAVSITNLIVIGIHWLRSISFFFSKDLDIGVIQLPFRQLGIFPLYRNASPFGSHSRRASRFTSSGPGAVIRSIVFTALNTSSEAVGLQNGASSALGRRPNWPCVCQSGSFLVFFDYCL